MDCRKFMGTSYNRKRSYYWFNVSFMASLGNKKTCLDVVFNLSKGNYLAIFLFGAAAPVLLFGLLDNQLTSDLQPLVVAYVLPQLFLEKANVA